MTRGTPPRDQGMSLAEVMTAMGIFVLVITILGSTAIAAIKATGTVATRQDNASQAESGSASAGKVLRTAVLPQQLEDTVCSGCDADPAIVAASATQISFYANLGRTTVGPSLVTLEVKQDPNRAGTAMLEQRLIDPTPLSDGRYSFCTAGATGCTVVKRPLATGLVWPTPNVFAYYDTSGAALALSSGGSLALADRAKISSIDVVIKVQTRPGQTRWAPFTAVQRVRLPNVEINLQLEAS